jgi:MFS family permease
MSVSPQEAPAEPGIGPDGPGTSFRELRLGRLLTTMTIAVTVLFLFWQAISSVFVALQVKAIDERGAAGGLALVLGLGAIGALLSAPVAGALSDRTRTRIGGRAPWMLVGTAVTVVIALLMPSAVSVTQLAVYWLLIQISTNFIFTPITVHIADRVPLRYRGGFSAAIGLAHLAGAFLGNALGSTFAKNLLVGYAVISALVLISIVGFVIANRRDNRDLPRTPVSLATIAKTYWVSPTQHPAFGWAFLGRFLLFSGYFPLTAYTLYMLQDYVHMGDAAVRSVPMLSLAGLIGAAIGNPLVGLLGDRLRVTRPLIYASAAVMFVGILVPLFVPTFVGMLVFSFVVGIGFGGYGSIDYVLMTKVLPSRDDAGKDLGIINITTTLSQTAGVALAGILISATGGYAVLFIFGAVAVVVGTACIAFIRNVS